jgi:hypothetical protein
MLKPIRRPKWFKEKQQVIIKDQKLYGKPQVFFVRDIRSDFCSLSVSPKGKLAKEEFDSQYNFKDLIPVGVRDWWNY